MRKHEMSEIQLQRRSLIIEKLSKFGWEGSQETERFDAGKICIPELRMNYESETLRLEVDYHAQASVIMLSITGDRGENIDLEIEFKDNLNKLLDVITSFQKKVSPDNFKELLALIIEVCPSTYIPTEDGFVQLTNIERV